MLECKGLTFSNQTVITFLEVYISPFIGKKFHHIWQG